MLQLVDPIVTSPVHTDVARIVGHDPVGSDIVAKSDIAVSFVLFKTAIDEIQRAIAQVRESGVDASIFLVDNSVPPLRLDWLADAKDVTLIQTGWNAGYGRAHNAAIVRSKSRYHVVMNTDLTYKPDVLGKLIAFMDDHPAAGLVMPRVLYPDGQLQHLCRLLPTPLDIFGRAFMRRSRFGRAVSMRYEMQDWTYDRIAQFPFLSGCFMFLRCSVLDQVGMFDERFFMYAEDLDLSRRIHAVAETLYFPEATIVHEYRSQAGFNFRRQLARLVNIGRYFIKWGWVFDRSRRAINKQTISDLYA